MDVYTKSWRFGRNLSICILWKRFSLPTAGKEIKSLRQKLCSWHAFFYRMTQQNWAGKCWLNSVYSDNLCNIGIFLHFHETSGTYTSFRGNNGVRYCVNLSCYPTCDIYLKNLEDGTGRGWMIVYVYLVFYSENPKI